MLSPPPSWARLSWLVRPGPTSGWPSHVMFWSWKGGGVVRWYTEIVGGAGPPFHDTPLCRTPCGRPTLPGVSSTAGRSSPASAFGEFGPLHPPPPGEVGPQRIWAPCPLFMDQTCIFRRSYLHFFAPCLKLAQGTSKPPWPTISFRLPHQGGWPPIAFHGLNMPSCPPAVAPCPPQASFQSPPPPGGGMMRKKMKIE